MNNYRRYIILLQAIVVLRHGTWNSKAITPGITKQKKKEELGRVRIQRILHSLITLPYTHSLSITPL